MARASKYGKMGRSFDSEGTSVLTSPPLSPPDSHSGQAHGHQPSLRVPGAIPRNDVTGQPMYYVQSPSRDSFSFNRGDTFSQSFAAKSSPTCSPLASPLHKSYNAATARSQPQYQLAYQPSNSYQQAYQQAYQQPYPQHQYQQFPQQYQQYPRQYPQQYQDHVVSDYYSSNSRPGPRQVLPQPVSASTGRTAAPSATVLPLKKSFQPWNGAIVQEDDSQYSDGRRMPKWCAVLLSIFFAIVCTVVVGFIYWLVCRPSAPKLAVKRIDFQNFGITEGDDSSGVPTQMLTMNCTTTLIVDNPSKYFGFHVSAPSSQLFFSDIIVTDGKSAKFYQKKRTKSLLQVNVHATRNPVYGAGPSLLSAFDSGEGLPLRLHITMKSEARIIWKIVRPTYRSSIACDVVLDSNSVVPSTGMLKLLKQDCH